MDEIKKVYGRNEESIWTKVGGGVFKTTASENVAITTLETVRSSLKTQLKKKSMCI